MTPRRFRPLLAAAGLLHALAFGGTVAHAQNGARPGTAAAAAAAPAPAKPVSSVTSPHGAALREACASCHRADGWKPARIAPDFKHADKTFPLTGAHVRTTCMSCHKSLDFRGAQTSCASCHTDTHNGELGTTCQRCHNTRSFVDRGAAVRSHEGSRFPLRGAHALATCESCHQRTAPGQQRFLARNATCASCHMDTFQATKSPAHTAAKFSTDCTSCHTITTWTGATFDHNTTTFPLTGRHLLTTCAGCHADKVFTGKSKVCSSCHAPDAAKATAPKHDGFPTACESCHTTSGWPGAKFDHDQMTKFALTGGHKAATCAQCHGDKVYKGKPTTCVSCHQTDFSKSINPDHAAAKLPTTCETCHTTAVWKGAKYDHSKTQFPLTGQHVAATCLACHADKVYGGKAMACASCHQKDATAAKNPVHTGFSAQCETCHTTSAWQGARFDHNSSTRFALTGAHEGASCAQCHGDGVFKGKSMACVSCHQAKFDAAVNPNHKAAGYPTTCEGCHSTTAWKPGLFDHSTTRFPLTGAHLATSCAQCHVNGVTRGTPMTCVSCHQGKYDASTQPHHKEARFGTTCETCHTTSKWLGAQWNHNTQTKFPLLGRHVAAACLACHSDRVYAGKPSVCQSCHQKDYDAAVTPNHRGFPTTCETCHSVNGWKPSSFSHDNTHFPLLGAHRAVSCESCHKNAQYTGTPTSCVNCHQANYDATTNPNHRASNLPTTCGVCHNPTSWKPASFDHNLTRFPLTGGHRPVACESCHKNGQYTGTPTTCVSCHQAKFDATTNPNHKTAGFSTTCQQCHTTAGWTPATFDHNATAFPLTGAHKTVVCLSCHKNGVYTGTVKECVGCHQAKFDATTNPNHKAGGFPTVCQSCHTTTAWTPSSFDHNATAFPLTGLHKTTSCQGCHGDGVFKGKTTVCSGCHLTKYNATSKPAHASNGIGTTCQTCHTTNGWTPATYDHSVTRFPLAGAHRAVSCAGCHGDGVYRGKSMACASCHLPKYNATTKPAHASNGIGTTCETCHTVTAWTPATYDHNATTFPLTGAHKTVTCAQCHGTGVYRGTSKVCSSCHLTDYNATTNPNHKTAMFPTTCETCHTTTQWTGATFNHDPWFPIYSGKHKGRWTSCTQCHANNANYKEFTCLTCHTKTKTDQQHQGRSGYSYTSPACYSCHPKGSAG
jgi:nitrate/TMAO reductase-like tetraheme cytochrome c subunit